MDLFGRKRIAQLEDSLATQKRIFEIQQLGWRDMEARYSQLNTKISILNRAMGRIIAKIDPTYAQDEIANPSRKTESDRIGDEVMRKLIGEHVASNRTGSM